jgi:16S rRNA G1207 methylase RsmC
MNDDFLNLESSCFDLIIANPPFTNNQDIDHVRKMYSVLDDGGRMIVITSVFWVHGSQKKQQEFKKWLYNDVNLVHEETLPAGTFKQSGTIIETMLLVIDK